MSDIKEKLIRKKNLVYWVNTQRIRAETSEDIPSDMSAQRRFRSVCLFAFFITKTNIFKYTEKFYYQKLKIFR